MIQLRFDISFLLTANSKKNVTLPAKLFFFTTENRERNINKPLWSLCSLNVTHHTQNVTPV